MDVPKIKDVVVSPDQAPRVRPELKLGMVEMPCPQLTCALCHDYLHHSSVDIWEHLPRSTHGFRCPNEGKRWRVAALQLAAEEL